jgi:hypothetical protein
MPGGSGLLDQLCERFGEVAAVACEVVEHCPSLCATYIEVVAELVRVLG